MVAWDVMELMIALNSNTRPCYNAWNHQVTAMHLGWHYVPGCSQFYWQLFVVAEWVNHDSSMQQANAVW